MTRPGGEGDAAGESLYGSLGRRGLRGPRRCAACSRPAFFEGRVR